MHRCRRSYQVRVCIVVEGCYPYVVGGVSSWIHSLIQSFSNIEFILLAIVANRTMRGRFVYELPENLTEVYEVYLEDVDWVRKRKEGRSLLKLSDREYRALRCLILNQYIDWSVLFQMFRATYSLARSFFPIFYGRCDRFICRCFWC